MKVLIFICYSIFLWYPYDQCCRSDILGFAKLIILVCGEGGDLSDDRLSHTHASDGGKRSNKNKAEFSGHYSRAWLSGDDHSTLLIFCLFSTQRPDGRKFFTVLNNLLLNVYFSIVQN